MPYRIAKSFTVESGHILSKHPGACRFPHGHSRTVEIVLVADTLDAHDMVCDFKAVKCAAQAFVERFDHSMALNTDDAKFADYQTMYGERIIPFPHTDPTSEAVARFVFDHVKAALAALMQQQAPQYPVRQTVRLERVRVTETASSWAEYWE